MSSGTAWNVIAWYLTNYLAMASLVPFMPVIFTHHGLSEQAVGAISALARWTNMPSGAVWSALADRFQMHRVIVLFTFAVAACVLVASSQLRSFKAIFGLTILQQFLGAPAYGSIIDAVVIADIKSTGVGEYGRVRLWGAVGWGLSAMACGEILETVGLAGNVAVFCLFGACSFALLPSLNYAAVWEEKNSEVDSDELELAALNPSGNNAAEVAMLSPTRTAMQVLCDVDVAMVLLAALVMGYAVGHIENFLFIYLDGLGGTSLLMGISLAVTCVSETIVFYFAERIKSTLGTWGCLNLIFLAFILRLAAYSALPRVPTLWLVLPVELLHGFTFGLAWSVGTGYFAAIAPKGTEATFQSFFQGAYFGVGYGLGGLLGGHVYGKYGPQILFFEVTCVIIAGWAFIASVRAMHSVAFRRHSTSIQPRVIDVELSQPSTLDL